MNTILWLPGWYPNKTDMLAGDFIQRHARAVARQQPVQIIFVVKDALSTTDISIQHTHAGNLHETIAYFKPRKTGLRPLDRLISIVTYRRISKQLVQDFIRQHGAPSLVHVHVALWGGPTAMWLKRKFHIPYIVTEHWTGYERNTEDNFYEKDAIFRYCTRKVLQQANLLLPVSDHLGKVLVRNFARVKYKVIPNVVDTQYFYPGVALVTVPRFIHVSGMNYQKNCEGILRVFSNLLAQKKEAELVMVGPATDELKLLAQQLGICGSVRWTGTLSYETVALELQQAACLVMFSRYENLPCAILEALCCGLPVIATRTGGIPEIIQQENGILVQPGNEKGLLAAMISITENKLGLSKDQISGNATKLFNYETVGKQLLVVYGEIVAGGSVF